MQKRRLKTTNLLIFSLLITLLLGMSESDIINISRINNNNENINLVNNPKQQLDTTIYQQHYIDLFGQQEFNKIISNDKYKLGMVGQLDNLRKFNLAQVRRISKKYYPSLFCQQTITQLANTLPATLLPNNLFSIITKLYNQQITLLLQYSSQSAILLLQQKQQQLLSLDKQLEKLTLLKRLLEFISRQLTAESDLRQIVYRVQQQQNTKWVNQIVRQAVGRDASIKDMLGEEFISQYLYTDQQKQQQPVRYFDAQGNQIKG